MDNYKQLYEKDNEEYKKFYPLTDILSIIDKESGKNLKQLLNQYNHIKLDWKGNTVDTRNSVPLILRHKGLFITYDTGRNIVTEYYTGDDISASINTIWQNDNNWTNFSIAAGLADQEDITEVNGKFKFADRNYNAAQFTGMGRLILRKNLVDIGEGIIKNVLTQDMINKSNTIYEIRYDFDLNGAKITIPESCVLNFQGGSFSNGNIIGNKTYISHNPINCFDSSIIIAGNWNIEALIPEWVKDVDDTIKLQWCLNHLNVCEKIKLCNRIYNVNNELVCKYSFILEGVSCPSNFNVNSAVAISSDKGSVIKTSKTEGAILYITYENNQYEAGGALIENVTFLGVRASNSGCSGIRFKPNNAPNRNIIIKDCVIKQCHKGITTDDDSHEMTNGFVEFSGLYINWCNYGIYSTGLNHWCSLHIHDCVIEGNSIANIFLYSSSRGVCISSVIIENNLLEQSPIGIKLSATKCNIRIEGNYFENDVNNFIDGRDVTCNCDIKGNYHYNGNCVYEISNCTLSVIETGTSEFKIGGSVKVIYSNVNFNISENLTSSSIFLLNEGDSFERGYEGVQFGAPYNNSYYNSQKHIKRGKGLKFPMSIFEAGEFRGQLNGVKNDYVLSFIPYYALNKITIGIHIYLRTESGSTLQHDYLTCNLSKGFGVITIITKANQDFSSPSTGIYLSPSPNIVFSNPIIGNCGAIAKINPKEIPHRMFISTKSMFNNLVDNEAIGLCVFDNTLNKPIYWTGSKWVDATGANV